MAPQSPVGILLSSEKLLPNTEYRIEASYLDGEEFTERPDVHFTTDSGALTTTPPVPTIASETHHTGSRWPEGGPTHWVTFRFQTPGIIVGAAGRQSDGDVDSIREYLEAKAPVPFGPVAGNFSGWTEPVRQVSLTPDEGFFCSTAKAAPSQPAWHGWAGLVLLGLGLQGRRRARRDRRVGTFQD